MASDPYVRQARGVFTGTVGATDFKAGDLIYYDGTDWERADADVYSTYAEAVAILDFSAGEVGAFCRSCILVDTDAPYTQGDQYYLTAPAGTAAAANITNTRPTGANNLVQVVGFALSSSEVYIDIPPVREQTIWVDLPYAEGSAAVTVDADWAGLSMTADADAAHGTQMFPQNVVGLEIAHLWGHNEDTLATGNYTIDVSAGADGEATAGTSDGITTTAVSEATNDDLWMEDVTAAFDGTGVVEPGNHFGVDVAKASETAADDYRYQGVAVVVLVV